MVYSIAERVEIISIFFENGKCARRTANLFNQLHADKQLHHPYVLALMRKFRQTGSVANQKKNYDARVRTEATEVAILGHINLDPTTSTRKLAEESGFSRTTVRRVLKHHKFHPYKIHLVHEINEDDPDRRLQFCEMMTDKINTNANFLFNICFSDECSFFVNGTVNRHNCRYWADENPRVFHETHTQYPLKLNVWAGIYGDRIVGPFFLPQTLNGETYLQLLEEAIDPALTDIIENDNRYLEDELFFQQDGAPPHYSRAVRQYLNERFPRQWIGRRGPIEWPARSPDLTPLDFFCGVI